MSVWQLFSTIVLNLLFNYNFITYTYNNCIDLSNVVVGLADDTWHHVCLSWKADSGLLAVFKDGERKYQSNGFWSSSQNLEIEGIITQNYKCCTVRERETLYAPFGRDLKHRCEDY